MPVACTLALAAAAAWAQVPLGPEFRVNTYTAAVQDDPAIASDASGNFVVVWVSSGQDGSLDGVFGQRFDAAGAAQGAEFQVNSYTQDAQSSPAVAMDADGSFVVVWESVGPDGSYHAVVGQRYDASGMLRGAEFLVNSYTTQDQAQPAVASDGQGGFVVVWASVQYGSVGVFGQRYDASGAPRAGEFRVNSDTGAVNYEPAVAVNPDGSFVVVWDGGVYGDQMYGQLYDTYGTPQGGNFQVPTLGAQSWPVVASDADGNFVVVWTRSPAPLVGDEYGAFGQRYDASGTPQGAVFVASASTTDPIQGAAVASEPGGAFIVAWQSYLDDSQGGVLARRYDADGMPEGGGVALNTYTTGRQGKPAVASLPNGNFVVAWVSDGQDGSSYGVFARRFAPDLVFRDGFQ